jgi:hypothetical protein
MPRRDETPSSLAVQLTPKSFALTASGPVAVAIPVLAFFGWLLWRGFSQ